MCCRLVVRLDNDVSVRPAGTPMLGCQNDGEGLLVVDVQGMVWFCSVHLEVGVIPVAPEPCPCCDRTGICLYIDHWAGVEERAFPIEACKKGGPPAKVQVEIPTEPEFRVWFGQKIDLVDHPS